MPIYEFVCQQCHELVELLFRNTQEKIEIKCPECGSSDLQRVLSRVNSVVAEGSGQAAGKATAPPAEHRSCPSGNCSTITLPGHSRSS